MRSRPTPTPVRRTPPLAIAVVLGLVGSAAGTVLGAAPAAAGGAPPPQIFVDTTDDVTDPADGLTSLREAFDEANSSGTANQIVLQDDATYLLDDCEGGTDENLNVGGDLDHTAVQLLSLLGNGATVQQTCTGERVIHDWLPDQPLYLEDVTITGGRTAASGGGVLFGGAGQILSSTIEGNVAGGPNGGGGVAAALQLVVSDSTIRDNVATGDGGGLRSFDTIGLLSSSVVGNTSAAAGGGASAGVEMIAINSTVTQNRALNAGGGLRSVAEETTVGQSTVVANRAPIGANVLSGAAIEVDVSVIALGSEGADCESAMPLQNGGSVGYDASCGGPSFDDLPAAHPMLAALAVPEGGITASMAPVVGSPVVDRFLPCPVASDQHGNPRPGGAACDSGAVEAAPPACAPTFTDVGGGHPFFDEICWLAQTGITEGFADGSFGGAQPVSRQAMAAFLYRLAMSPPPPLVPPTFTDVALDHPFATEIGWLADEQISEGYADNTFRPGDPVTRQAMAAFLFRVAGNPGILLPPAPTFPDVPLSHPFFEEVEWMADSGVSTGYADGTWRPADPVTRQAMAAFMQRMAQDVELAGL